MKEAGQINRRVIERMSKYRRLLTQGNGNSPAFVHSHDISQALGVSSAQVRRDLMEIPLMGNTNKGYERSQLSHHLQVMLEHPNGYRVAMIGCGDLARSVLRYFGNVRPNLRFVIGFDSDPAQCGRVVDGCRFQEMDNMAEWLETNNLDVAVIACGPDTAQSAADALVKGGVVSLVNMTSEIITVPSRVTLIDINLITILETAALLSQAPAHEVS